MNLTSKFADDRRFRLLRLRQIMVMLVGYGLFYVCRLAFSATKKTMIEQGVYTTEQIGSLGAAMLWAYAIGKMSSGFVADRANIRWLFAGGLLVSSLVTMSVGFAIPFAILLALWFVNGLAQSTGAPSCVVSLARWWPSRTRGTYYGIWSCSNNLGEVLAYVVTGVLVVWVGARYGADMAWRSGFWGAAAMGLCGVVMIALLMRNRPEDEGLPSLVAEEGAASSAGKPKGMDVGRGQKLALTSWAVWMIALSGAFFCMSRYAIIDWGIFFLEVKKGYSTSTAATIITVNSVVGAVSSALSGIISDRCFKGSRNELALIAGLMNVAGLAIFMLVPGQHVWLDVFAMVLFGLAVGILLTFLGGLMAVDLVPRLAAGAALGIAGLGNYFGAGLQSIVSGFFITKDAATNKAVLLSHTFANGYTLDYLSIFWIGMALLSVICALSVWKQRPQVAAKAADEGAQA